MSDHCKASMSLLAILTRRWFRETSYPSMIVFKQELVDTIELFEEPFDTCEDYDFHLLVRIEACVRYFDS